MSFFYERKKLVQMCPGLCSFIQEFIFGIEVWLAAIMSVVFWILEVFRFLAINL